MSTATDQVLGALAGQLVVSVQSYPGEPLRHPETMAQMAEAVVAGGAAAIRAQGLADIAAITGRVGVPVIGLWKVGTDGVFITPTLRHALAVAHAGADIVALDGTRRPRPDHRTLRETLSALRAACPDVLFMADCATLDDARAAADAGADLLGTTLAGYTPDRPTTDGPDLDLLTQIVTALPAHPVLAEGRIHTPTQARQALDAGAHAVVVGTAITHPTSITGWFAQALRPCAVPPGMDEPAPTTYEEATPAWKSSSSTPPTRPDGSPPTPSPPSSRATPTLSWDWRQAPAP